MAGRIFEKGGGLNNEIPKTTGWLSSCGDSECVRSPQAQIPRCRGRESGWASLFMTRVLLDRGVTTSEKQRGLENK